MSAALSGPGDTLLDALLARFVEMSPEEQKRNVEAARAVVGNPCWVPNPGPQTDAFFSKADLLLYGGQGGGGKSSLVLGLALTEHKRSLVMRRQYGDLGALTDEAIRFNGTRDGFNGSSPPKLRTKDNRLIEFGGASTPGSEQSWQGRAHDFLGIDEAVQMLESQVRFLMGWVRSTDPKQRCRTVLATNPPLDAAGQYIVRMFRPWLDITHPKPAQPGELRWFVTDPDGEDVEVDDSTPIEMDGKTLLPKSRTFIPAALRDNPFLADTGYQSTLDALPEPVRSAVRDGNFMAARGDAAMQVIPMAWVLAAEERWSPLGGRDEPMTAMALDPAGGGRDSAELCVRHGGWYGPMISAKGEETADGSRTAATVMQYRKDQAPVVVDVGGGYAGGVIMRLKDNGVPHTPFNGSGASTGRTRDKTLKFANKRSEAWWRFREELDPDQEGGSVVALPADPELRGDLTAPTFTLTARGIQVESKVVFGDGGKITGGIKKRLGRSPGKGDVVVMAMSEGTRARLRMVQRHGYSTIEQALSGDNHGRPSVVQGHMAVRRALGRG